MILTKVKTEGSVTVKAIAELLSRSRKKSSDSQVGHKMAWYHLRNLQDSGEVALYIKLKETEKGGRTPQVGPRPDEIYVVSTGKTPRAVRSTLDRYAKLETGEDEAACLRRGFLDLCKEKKIDNFALYLDKEEKDWEILSPGEVLNRLETGLYPSDFILRVVQAMFNGRSGLLRIYGDGIALPKDESQLRRVTGDYPDDYLFE